MISSTRRKSEQLWLVILSIGVMALSGCSGGEEDPADSIQAIDYAAIEARLPEREPRGKVSDPFPNVLLTDQFGQTYRFFDDLIKERPIVVNFMFTECALVCPGTTSNLVRLHAAFDGAVGKELTFVSISLDPENDTQVKILETLTHHSFSSYSGRSAAGPVTLPENSINVYPW